MDKEEDCWTTVTHKKNKNKKLQGSYQVTLTKRATKKPLRLNL